MAAAITDVTKIGARAWRYTYTGTADFTVYMFGAIVYQGANTTFVAEWPYDSADHQNEPPQIEVIDSTQTAAALSQTLYPYLVTIQFRGQTTNSYYLAEVYDGADWIGNTKVIEDGSGYYTITVPGETPASDYQFRITPYDVEGNAGDPLLFSVFHHTAPDPPQLSYTYDAGTGLVTIL
jgi:hypothetical protein